MTLRAQEGEDNICPPALQELVVRGERGEQFVEHHVVLAELVVVDGDVVRAERVIPERVLIGTGGLDGDSDERTLAVGVGAELQQDDDAVLWGVTEHHRSDGRAAPFHGIAFLVLVDGQAQCRSRRRADRGALGLCMNQPVVQEVPYAPV